MRFYGIHLKAISQRVPRQLFLNFSLKNYIFAITVISPRGDCVDVSIGQPACHSASSCISHTIQWLEGEWRISMPSCFYSITPAQLHVGSFPFIISSYWLTHLSLGDLNSISKLQFAILHYSNIIMGEMASQITSITIVYWTVNSGVDQKEY